MVVFVFNILMLEVVVCLVDIGGITDYHCLNFLIITIQLIIPKLYLSQISAYSSMAYRHFEHLRIRSLTCYPLLKCRGIGHLRKSYIGVHVSGYDLRLLRERKVAL